MKALRVFGYSCLGGLGLLMVAQAGGCPASKPPKPPAVPYYAAPDPSCTRFHVVPLYHGGKVVNHVAVCDDELDGGSP